MADATVTCETISTFDSDSYDDGDKFRNAVIVPQETLAGLDSTDEYGYVRVTKHDADTEGVLTQIVAFSDAHDAERFSVGDDYMACVRTSLQKRIGIEPGDVSGDAGAVRLDIHEHDSEALDGLTAHRISAWEQHERDITTDGFACYIHEADMDELAGLAPGDTCELVNPETGVRIQLPAQTYRHKHYDRGTIRLNGVIRTLLGVQSGDEGTVRNVVLRVPDDDPPSVGTVARLKAAAVARKRAVADWVGRRFVDYSYTQLRVLPGYDRDEGRNIVRINEDTMEVLGIEENDRVVIEWKDAVRRVRCQSGWDADDELEPTEDVGYGGHESLAVRVPSTERDRLDVSVNDSVRIRRDMRYQAGKQVSLSVFGIFGVIVGTNQLLNLFFEDIGLGYGVAAVVLVAVLSIFTVWLILNPVRQKCRTPG